MPHEIAVIGRVGRFQPTQIGKGLSEFERAFGAQLTTPAPTPVGV